MPRSQRIWRAVAAMDVESSPPLIHTPDVARAEPVGDSGPQKFLNVDVFVRPPVSDSTVVGTVQYRLGRSVPASQVKLCAAGSRRTSAKVVVAGSWLKPNSRKSADGELVQRITDPGMQTNAIERVAEDDGAVDLGVVERLDAEMVASTKEAPCRSIPDRKGEVAQQMLDAVLSPRVIRM